MGLSAPYYFAVVLQGSNLSAVLYFPDSRTNHDSWWFAELKPCLERSYSQDDISAPCDFSLPISDNLVRFRGFLDRHYLDHLSLDLPCFDLRYSVPMDAHLGTFTTEWSDSAAIWILRGIFRNSG